MRKGIYIASKTRHAGKWKMMRDDGVPIISTWIDEAGPGESKSLRDLWKRCIDEASIADAVILYAEPEDVLKGAFIEVGAALALGKPIFVVGRQENWSWTEHPLVTVCESLMQALLYATQRYLGP